MMAEMQTPPGSSSRLLLDATPWQMAATFVLPAAEPSFTAPYIWPHSVYNWFQRSFCGNVIDWRRTDN
jgi:hypothetical protein